MKVVRLHAVNIKKIKEADIAPSGNLILISGKNGQGKTSILDCLLYALAGKREIPNMPIRQGEDSGKIELDLGEIKVVRTFTEKETYLKVLTKEGAEYPDAQRRLDSMLKSIYFDPMQFADMKPAEQKETLLNLIGVNILNEDVAEVKARSERTITGRMLKQAEGELAGIETPSDADKKLKEVSIIELTTKQASLRSVLDDQAQKAMVVQEAGSLIEAGEAQIKELQAQLKTLKESKKNAEGVLKVATVKATAATKELGQIELALSKADATNAKVRQVSHYVEAKSRVDAQQKTYDEWSAKIDEAVKAKSDKLAKAEMPVKGITIGVEGVEFNGLPFEQLSKSEQIKISLGIAMAQDTGLKLIRIMDGSLLDSDNMTVIKDMAVARDYQVWVEIVDETGGIGYYVEDGEITKVN